MCDTYCGLVPHGGGAFSGKDPSKVDRSGAYMSRYVAKNLVANGYCKECLVSVAYVFGEENPVMLEVLTDNPNNNKIIKSKVIEMFDFSPKAIIDKLSLNKFRYKPTATYGHFTNGMYPWEKIENF
jgi:S-adenosylmethionine synthetase